MISHVVGLIDHVVGLIDIEHMQSVIKVFFFFFQKLPSTTILVIWKPSDRETPS